MKTIIKKTNDESTLKEAADILKKGGICAFPTDTVYGLGAVYTNDEAVKKIFAAKGRDENKPLSILVSSPEQAALLSDEISDEAYKLMRAFWPGALTIVVKKNASVSDIVSAGKDTVGIRMPACRAAVRLIELSESPLAAPSANISGRRSSVCFEDVFEDLYGRIDMILDAGACEGGISSTVAQVSGDKIKILRQGQISRLMIDNVLSGN